MPCRAFSLVEVVMALAIASFALLAIIGLLPVGVNTLQSSTQETVATNLATGIVADLGEVRKAAASQESARYKVDVSGSGKTFYLGESGELVNETSPSARFRAVVKLAGVSGSRQATSGSVTLYWPANTTNTANSVTVFVALDRN